MINVELYLRYEPGLVLADRDPYIYSATWFNPLKEKLFIETSYAEADQMENFKLSITEEVLRTTDKTGIVWEIVKV